MKKARFICVILTVSLLLSLFVPYTAAADGAKSEIPYADTRDTATSPYWYKEMNIYTEQEADASSVPSGYSGYVMKLTGDTASGITVDFSGESIPVTSVKALHIRVYYGSHTKEVRISTDAGTSWVLRHLAEKPDTWEEIVISDINDIKKLSDKNGKLGIFGFGFRNNDDGSKNNVAYIDEIRAELEAGDGIPPEIRYDGPEHITTSAGKPFEINATAWDEGEKALFPIEYIWDKEATDGDGNLTEGEYELILRASDSYGNSAEKKLTVSVGKKDTEAPVIDFSVTDIKTVAGAYVRLDFKAKDNYDTVTVTQSWSNGALDRQGRITEGTHTLTLTSADLTGNTATFTVNVTAAKTLH